MTGHFLMFLADHLLFLANLLKFLDNLLLSLDNLLSTPNLPTPQVVAQQAGCGEGVVEALVWEVRGGRGGGGPPRLS